MLTILEANNKGRQLNIIATIMGESDHIMNLKYKIPFTKKEKSRLMDKLHKMFPNDELILSTVLC